jgi:hypothetical protein
MPSQRRWVGGVRTLSPSGEGWAKSATEALPAKVTVEFENGDTGFLDMSSARAAHWARRIDKLHRAQQPVYVEIDDETGVITNVRVPRRFKVESIEPGEHSNLLVRLIPSSAIHLLLHSDPNFETMRASLEAARLDASERLITETRDEHEIIDVRTPDSPPPGGPGESTPPGEDPPVSEARANDIFNNMKTESCSPCSPSSDCIPFLYPDDGCWIRAHIMCHLMRNGGPDPATNPPEDPEKVWIRGSLNAPTANHPDCHVMWGWHVAPTLMTALPGGNDKLVVDPSLSPHPESKAAWKARQGNPGATLTDSPWTSYNFEADMSSWSLADSRNDSFIVHCRDELRDRCLDFGPPPYSCTRGCFFIIDRSTFSDDEVEAMLLVTTPATVQSAFYVVVDGFSPNQLGFTAATMQHTPTLNALPTVAGMTITPVRLEFEYPTHLNRRQRLTWVYDITFANVSDFTGPFIAVTLQASMSTVASTGALYLIQQPNPYEIDGETSWLSTDVRVFQIRQGDPKFGATMASDPSAFITQVLANLNNGTTGGQTFENDISVDQQTSRLELSGTVAGTPVYNFAVAKVRYRSLLTSATDVRVFFRLFPVATTSLEYDQATVYRRHTSGATVVPLLGIKNNEIASIPCFAAPRVNSAVASLTTQTDPANVLTMPPNAGGSEVVRYFGCWLDINQTQSQFPLQPMGDGPYASGRQSIQDLIRNEHQCLVSEIAFTPAPAQNGSTPSLSDKLAQRNLAIVQSANPGLVFSRRIPQTFEVRPSAARQDQDELMFDWGNVPDGSVATVYMPGVLADDVLRLAARKYRTHRLIRIDEHTVRFDTGGINYLPIPFTDANLPGLLTVDLPEGIKKGQAFRCVVRQVAGGPQAATRVFAERNKIAVRHIVGSFQLTIPVSTKAQILPGQQRLLSNLRWIERAIPADNRWAPVFGKYVAQVAARVDALGGNASRVAASSSGKWQDARRRCLMFTVLATLLIAVLAVGSGVLPLLLATVSGILLLVGLAGTLNLWRKSCRSTMCQQLRVVLIGSVIGALLLALAFLLGQPTPRVVAAFIAFVCIAATATVAGWSRGCFR